MKIFEKILGSNTLYYPGCLTKFVAQDLLENYRKILRQLKIDFIELKELEVCCGSPVLKAGFADDFKDLAEKNLKVFKEHSVKKIITNCPACAFVFKEEYPRVLGKKWDIEVEHITQVISSKFKTSAFAKASAFRSTKSADKQNSKITYHDPCHLGRQLGIYDEPREIIKKAGFEITEMTLSKELSFCCGAGGSVKAVNPELAEKICQERISQAEETGAEILVTACPMCHLHLEEKIKKLTGVNIKEKELSELILEKLK